MYDLVINTAVLDLDSAVDLICLAVEHKASRLSVPVEELAYRCITDEKVRCTI